MVSSKPLEVWRKSKLGISPGWWRDGTGTYGIVDSFVFEMCFCPSPELSHSILTMFFQNRRGTIADESEIATIAINFVDM